MLKELGKYKNNLSSIFTDDETLSGLLLKDSSGISDEVIAAEAKNIFCPISTWSRQRPNRPAIFFWKPTSPKRRPQ